MAFRFFKRVVRPTPSHTHTHSLLPHPPLCRVTVGWAAAVTIRCRLTRRAGFSAPVVVTLNRGESPLASESRCQDGKDGREWHQISTPPPTSLNMIKQFSAPWSPATHPTSRSKIHCRTLWPTGFYPEESNPWLPARPMNSNEVGKIVSFAVG